MTERQTGEPPWASKSWDGETEAEREEAGLGRRHRQGRTAGGTDTLSRDSVFLPSNPPGGPRSQELHAT